MKKKHKNNSLILIFHFDVTSSVIQNVIEKQNIETYSIFLK